MRLGEIGQHRTPRWEASMPSGGSCMARNKLSLRMTRLGDLGQHKTPRWETSMAMTRLGELGQHKTPRWETSMAMRLGEIGQHRTPRWEASMPSGGSCVARNKLSLRMTRLGDLG